MRRFGASWCALAVLVMAGGWAAGVELCVQGRWPYGPSAAVAVDGELMVTSSGVVLLAVDIADPTSPDLLGEVPLPARIRALAVRDGLAYADVGSDVRIVDLTTPPTPAVVAALETPGLRLQMSATDDRLYVADSEGGLLIFDVSDPTAPVELSSLPAISPAIHVATSGRWAWVGAHPSQGRLWLVDIADPTAPVERGALGLPTAGLAAAGDSVYVATDEVGLAVVSPCVGLFADGFESGDTSAWTTTTGGARGWRRAASRRL